jgi:tRNA pseudouridine65 synthase
MILRNVKSPIEAQSPSWVLVDKPAGFHSHPPEDPQIRMNPRRNALGILRKQLGYDIAPAHRLDRAASGLLLFTRESNSRSDLQKQFSTGEMRKTYYVAVRGVPEGVCDFQTPLEDKRGTTQEAETFAEPCFSFHLPLPHPRGGNRQFTILEVRPKTGRFHQIRRHFALAGFPIIGDSRHGDRRLNREFAALTGISCLFLRCMTIEFFCPDSRVRVRIGTRWSRDWHKLFDLAGACARTSVFRQ